jgi:hypothetical protein
MQGRLLKYSSFWYKIENREIIKMEAFLPSFLFIKFSENNKYSFHDGMARPQAADGGDALQFRGKLRIY